MDWVGDGLTAERPKVLCQHGIDPFDEIARRFGVHCTSTRSASCSGCTLATCIRAAAAPGQDLAAQRAHKNFADLVAAGSWSTLAAS